ncbi:MAG: hypothetical protein WKG00_12160 [Polyangiaceae bacterium]
MEAPSSGPRAIVSTRTVRCRADICSLWNAITDTERLNRAVGMDRVSLSPISDSSAARYLASTRLGGFSVQYEERPYEWVYLQQFKVLRKMRNGPVASLEMSFVLDRNELGGTDLRLTLTMVPRIALLQPIVRFRAAQNLKRFEREIEQLDATLAGAEPGALPARALTRGTATVHESALGRAAKKLGGIDAGAAARRLVGYVRDAGDVDVSRMRPFSLAEEPPRREVLAACLHAVTPGCSTCAGGGARASTATEALSLACSAITAAASSATSPSRSTSTRRWRRPSLPPARSARSMPARTASAARRARPTWCHRSSFRRAARACSRRPPRPGTTASSCAAAPRRSSRSRRARRRSSPWTAPRCPATSACVSGWAGRSP